VCIGVWTDLGGGAAVIDLAGNSDRPPSKIYLPFIQTGILRIIPFQQTLGSQDILKHPTTIPYKVLL